MIHSKKHHWLKRTFSALSLFTLIYISSPSNLVWAADPCAPNAAREVPKGCTYVPLTTIPNLTVGCVPDGNGNTDHCIKANPVKVLSNVYGVAIGIAAILAIGMIIWAGILYATTEAIQGKSEAKEHWHGALWGLLLLVSAFLILRTINVQLVDVDLSLGAPVECSVLDASGNKVPCTRLSNDPLGDSIRNLRTQISTQNQAINALNENVSVAQKNLEKAMAQTSPAATDTEINELQAKRDDALQAKANAEYQATKLYSYTSAAELVKTRIESVDTMTTVDARSSYENFTREANTLLADMQNQKTNSGSSVFSQQEIDAVRSQLAQQSIYMRAVIEWREASSGSINSNYTVSGQQTATKPTKPVFTLPIN